MTPTEKLRHHISGAIERGEGKAIVEMTMETVLQKSIDMHPTLLIDALRQSKEEDWNYLGKRQNGNQAVERAIKSRIAGLDKAINALTGTAGGDAKAVALMGLGPLILAFNEACRLQCIPHHRRTEIAVNS